MYIVHCTVIYQLLQCCAKLLTLQKEMPKKFESDQEAVFSMAFLTKVTNIIILNFLLCQHDQHGAQHPHHHDFHPDQPEEDEAA